MLETDIVIDIESGLNSAERVVENHARSDDMVRDAVCNVAIIADDLAKGGSPVSKSCSPKEIGGELSPEAGANGANKNEKHKSLSAKKPPKPPRPPRGLSLDAADQRLIRELSELAMIKRARIERMKALKKMKAARASSLSGSTPSSGNWIAMLITFLFCFVLLFQGYQFPGNLTSHSRGIGVPGSPESTAAPKGDIILVHSHWNFSSGVPLIDA